MTFQAGLVAAGDCLRKLEGGGRPPTSLTQTDVGTSKKIQRLGIR